MASPTGILTRSQQKAAVLSPSVRGMVRNRTYASAGTAYASHPVGASHEYPIQ